jgi:branched-chain amino acid transport system ATP-binding protein
VSFLEIRDLAVSYGGIRALRDVSLHVEEGEIVALLGSNGAGKTTTLRAISGLVPYSGSIVFRGDDLRRWSPDRIVSLGLGHAPEGRRIFSRMTVRENLLLGAYTERSREVIDERLASVLQTFPRLGERLTQSAGTLSGGEQQMLAIGRALMSAPRLLMLDEPSLGLAPIVVQTIFGVIKTLNERGTTILLVEQNAHQALRIANRGYVLETGEIRFEDTGAALLENPAVAEAYLGVTPV